MGPYRALGCDPGEAGPASEKSQPAREMSLETSPMTVRGLSVPRLCVGRDTGGWGRGRETLMTPQAALDSAPWQVKERML